MRQHPQLGAEIRESSQSQCPLIGQTPAIRNLRAILPRIRASNANVLIIGETGSGKEVIARNLASSGSSPFISVDSSTIHGSMAESVLFGHERGAFTGAVRSQKGLFEESDGGIIYFDEISNMPLEIQAKLLRVLQEKEILKLGSSKVIRSNFRVISATNKDLEEMVSKGLFKEDLYQRLNVLPVRIPPLRERSEDIPLLIRHFLQIQACDENALIFDFQAMEQMKRYFWPGNVRELSNTVAYLLALGGSKKVGSSDLPERFWQAPDFDGAETENEGQECFYDRVSKYEKELLSDQYRRMGGNIRQMAIHLKMNRSNLYTKLKKYGLV